MSDEPNIEDSELVDEFGQDGTGSDDGYFIELYKAPNGRHFVRIASSGYNSKFHGSLGFHTWITEDQIDSWTEA